MKEGVLEFLYLVNIGLLIVAAFYLIAYRQEGEWIPIAVLILLFFTGFILKIIKKKLRDRTI